MQFRESQNIVKDLLDIFKVSGIDAIDYLNRVRTLESKFGTGFAISYCWFYSTPQKWMFVEPKIFDLAERTESFDLETILEINFNELSNMFKPLLYSNELSFQFSRFCKAIKGNYGTWTNFKKAIMSENLSRILNKLRKSSNIRLTFKNLAAMASFVGNFDIYPILDTHVGKILGINKYQRAKCVIHGKSFEEVKNYSEEITSKLANTFHELTTIQWSLSVWFNGSGLSSNDLLSNY